MSVPVPQSAIRRIVIASRESALAMWQARHVESCIRALDPVIEVEIRGMTTEGDRLAAASLAQHGGKGLFVKELEEALARGRADIAVHSMKDVPMRLPDGYEIAAILERADPRDAFCSLRYRALSELPSRARVGTSSLRRESQIRARHPQLEVAPLRGNVPTRLRKLDEGQFDAIIVAAAGLKRLGLDARITALLEPDESLPAPGQGALGIECLARRGELREFLTALNHETTARCVAAERAVSRALTGSCSVPLGAFAEVSGARMRLRGFVGAPDGARLANAVLEGPADEPAALGERLADELRRAGADAILAALERGEAQ